MNMKSVVTTTLLLLCTERVISNPLDDNKPDFANYGDLDDELIVKINDGYISGSTKGGVRQWRSIPYARPPVGELRWAPPQPPTPWGDQVIITDTDPVGCPQSCDLPPHGCPAATSEDCLFLNVFAPIPETGDETWPVMFWIHGGSFNQGWGGGPLYNGSYLSLHNNAVIVSINYRLGALGFIWSALGPDGNYGFLDQRLALEWTASNIAYFGGDPNRITLFGQSAGSMSCGLHMVMDYGNPQPLYHSVIMESNPFGIPFRDVATWGTLPTAFYNYIGCDQDRYGHDTGAFWDCIRGVSVDLILEAQKTLEVSIQQELPDHFLNLFLAWTPTMGTDMFSKQSFFQFQDGHYVDIPYVIGTVKDEGLDFVWAAFPDPVGKLEMDALMDVIFGPENSRLIRQQYPYPTNTSDYRAWSSQVVTDGIFRCPCWNTSMVHADLYRKSMMRENSWSYHFNHVSSFGEEFWGPVYYECWDAVCHAAELPYVFHPNPGVEDTTFTDDETYLMYHFASYWTNFATYHEPGSGYVDAPANNSGVYWANFEFTNGTLFLDTGDLLQMKDNWDEQFCEFWNSLGYSWMK